MCKQKAGNVKEILIVRISDIMEAFINIFTHGCLTNEKRAVLYWHIYHSLSAWLLPAGAIALFASRGDTQQSRGIKRSPKTLKLGHFITHGAHRFSVQTLDCPKHASTCCCVRIHPKNVAAHFTFPPADSLRNVFRGKFLPSENFIRMTNGTLL